MRARSVSLAVVVAALGITAPAASATTFTVNSLGDQSDASLAVDICEVSPLTPGDECTLRAAIEQANASSAGAPHKIHFALGAGSTIPVNAVELPAVTRAGTEIDGCSAGDPDDALRRTAILDGRRYRAGGRRERRDGPRAGDLEFHDRDLRLGGRADRAQLRLRRGDQRHDRRRHGRAACC